jgi:hypothetical protein
MWNNQMQDKMSRKGAKSPRKTILVSFATLREYLMNQTKSDTHTRVTRGI